MSLLVCTCGRNGYLCVCLHQIKEAEVMEQGKNRREREAFIKKVYDDYYQRLCFYASKFVADAEDAKDIVQDLLVKLWESDVEFENEQALSSWLHSGVYHACLNRKMLADIHERHHREILRETNEADPTNYLTTRIEHEVMWEVFSAVDELPEESRKVFKLSYLEGRGIQEVADILHISTHTVKSQRAYARKLLKDRLKDLYPAIFFFGYMLH